LAWLKSINSVVFILPHPRSGVNINMLQVCRNVVTLLKQISSRLAGNLAFYFCFTLDVQLSTVAVQRKHRPPPIKIDGGRARFN
jgi:hypothetical protein